MKRKEMFGEILDQLKRYGVPAGERLTEMDKLQKASKDELKWYLESIKELFGR